MTVFSTAVTICSGVTSIITLIVLLVRPVRERWLGTKAIQDGQKCLLRSDMLRTYYRHNAQDTIRQYEAENFELEYKAYKALGGNSFIDRIHDEVKTWDVQS